MLDPQESTVSHFFEPEKIPNLPASQPLAPNAPPHRPAPHTPLLWMAVVVMSSKEWFIGFSPKIGGISDIPYKNLQTSKFQWEEMRFLTFQNEHFMGTSPPSEVLDQWIQDWTNPLNFSRQPPGRLLWLKALVREPALGSRPPTITTNRATTLNKILDDITYRTM